MSPAMFVLALIVAGLIVLIFVEALSTAEEIAEAEAEDARRRQYSNVLMRRDGGER